MKQKMEFKTVLYGLAFVAEYDQKCYMTEF